MDKFDWDDRPDGDSAGWSADAEHNIDPDDAVEVNPDGDPGIDSEIVQRKALLNELMTEVVNRGAW